MAETASLKCPHHNGANEGNANGSCETPKSAKTPSIPLGDAPGVMWSDTEFEKAKGAVNACPFGHGSVGVGKHGKICHGLVAVRAMPAGIV
jgi:hypothetical protein